MTSVTNAEKRNFKVIHVAVDLFSTLGLSFSLSFMMADTAGHIRRQLNTYLIATVCTFEEGMA